MKSIIITGVSSGIGLACAECFARAGYHVFGSVRKTEDAKQVSNKIPSNFTSLLFDVTDVTAIQKSVEIVKNSLDKIQLKGLINNAGIAVSGPLMHVSPDEFRSQLETNVIGTHNVTQSFLPLLGAVENYNLEPGKILNISSVSGKIAYPFLGPYAASKHALEAWATSLRRELQIFGIDVITIGPASVTTPMWTKDAVSKILEKYDHTAWGSIIQKFKEEISSQEKQYLDAQKLAENILLIFQKKKPRVRYAFARNKIKSWYLPRIIPARIFDKLIYRSLMK